MLIEFSVKNYLSFKDRATLSMVASPDNSLPENLIKNAQGTKIDLLKSAVIYGANASGKSNFIKAFSFMENFVRTSTDGQDDTPINVRPFKLIASCLELPSEFEVVFIRKGIRYIYGFSADRKDIHEEWFYNYPKGQRSLLFERKQSSSGAIVETGKQFKGEKKKIEKLTRHNSLFVTVAAQFNNEIAKIVLEWFRKQIKFSDEPIKDLMFTLAGPEFIPETKEAISGFLRRADLGINDYKYKPEFLTNEDFDKVLSQITHNMKKNNIGKIEAIKDGEKVTVIHPDSIMCTHKGKDSKGKSIDVDFSFEDESDGTKTLFGLSGPWIYVLMNGLVLIRDELETRLHPSLSRWLINIFNLNKANPHGAQLIFTTHNTDLLDNKLFRRDQIWFTEKKHATGATDLFSLWDVKKKPRKHENFRKNYLEGSYGAIPILEKFE